MCVSLSHSTLHSLSRLESIIQDLGDVNMLFTVGTQGVFQWFDGPLVRAVENGNWLLLENANLCNPTVLDRLNSLLEPHGVLVINERGGGGTDTETEALSITPHPHFRLFMTMDSRYGEVSRAMRNRGVEISLLPPAITTVDCVSLLQQAGISNSQLAQRFVRFSSCDKPSLVFLIHVPVSITHLSDNTLVRHAPVQASGLCYGALVSTSNPQVMDPLHQMLSVLLFKQLTSLL